MFPNGSYQSSIQFHPHAHVSPSTTRATREGARAANQIGHAVRPVSQARAGSAERTQRIGAAMVGFIVTGHGTFSGGLASAIAMVAGDQPEFQVVPFDEAAAATYGDDLHAAIESMASRTSGVVVFVDLLGGTPFNQAMLASQDIEGVRVVTGTNLPMLIETLFMRNANEAMTVDEIVALALEVGPSGIVSKQLEPAAAKAEDEFDGEGL